jgi:hypothetical protein
MPTLEGERAKLVKLDEKLLSGYASAKPASAKLALIAPSHASIGCSEPRCRVRESAQQHDSRYENDSAPSQAQSNNIT